MSGELVGNLHYDTGEYSFEYNSKYSGEEFEGLVKGEVNRSVELFSYFENLIPEYDRRDRLLNDKADLHLKNIGALEIGNKKYILAPLYDLISVGVYNEESWDLGLPLKDPYKKPKN